MAPTPERSPSDTPPPAGLVGRRPEWARLAEAVAAAGAGRGGLLVLTGEAGIGKTRLLAEVDRHASAVGMRVVRAAGWQDAGVPSFWIWTQVVRSLVGDQPLDVLRSQWAAHVDLLVGLLPERAEATVTEGDDPSPGGRFPLFDAVASLVGRTARDRPLVLLLDDLHWADQGSLRLLRYLAGAVAPDPVLVVAAWRDHDGPDGDLDVLRDRAEVLEVPPLSVVEVQELLEAQHRLSATPADAQRVAARTAGNPLFVGEIGRLAVARGLDAVGDALPASAVATIGRRVARLSQPAAEVLAAAAVAGAHVDPDLLTRMLGIPEATVQLRLDEAERVGLLTPTRTGLTFAHALVRDAVEAGLSEGERRRRHLAAAEALESRPGRASAADLARHLSRAGPLAPAGAAARRWAEAGEAAWSAQAYEVAADAYGQALAALPATGGSDGSDGSDGWDGPARSPLDRSALLERRGDALLRSDDLTAARVAFTQAAELARVSGQPEALARAALGFAAGLSGFEVRLFDHAQIDLLEEALHALPVTDGEQRTYVMARLSVALAFVGTPDRRAALAADAVAMARRIGSPTAHAHALAALCDAIAGPTESERRTELASEIVDLATQLDHTELVLLGLRLRVVALLEQGQVHLALRDVRQFGTLAARLRQPLFGWYVPLWQGFACHLVGDLEGMDRHSAEVRRIATQTDSSNARILGAVQQLAVCVERGDRSDELRALLTELAGALEVQPSAESMVGLFPGQPDELRRRALPLLPRLSDELAVDAEYVPNLLLCSWSVIEGRDRGEPARILYDLLLPHAHRFGVDGIAASFYGSVERFLGSLAWLAGGPLAEAAEGHLRRAVTLNEEVGARLAATHSRRELGRVLLERDAAGDHDAARTLLAEAADAYAAMGLAGRAEAARRLRPLPPLAHLDHPVDVVAPGLAVFRRSGDVWELAYRGREARVRDGKGMRDLARLLSRPGREVHALDLVGPAAGVAHEGHLGDVLDDQARVAYRRRLGALDEAIAEADDLGHTVAADRAREERDALVAELSAAYGLGGRPRRTGDPGERARSAVTWRIRDAIGRIEREHEELGRHLRAAVRTGTYCRYAPEVAPDWRL